MGRRNPVAELHSISHSFGKEAARRKVELLDAIAETNRFDVDELLALQDTLSFLRAYPDDPRVLRGAVRLASRLRDHAGRSRLRNHGFPGSSNSHPYSYEVLQRLVRRFPGCLEIDWEELEDDLAIHGAVLWCLTPGERQGLDDTGLTVQEWLAYCRPVPPKTDLELVLELFERSSLPAPFQSLLFENCDLTVRFELRVPGSGRAEATVPIRKVHYQKRDITREHFPIAPRILEPIRKVPIVDADTGAEIIDVALAALCSRNLEIYSLIHANPHDVTLVDCGRGVSVALVGVLPEFRSALESLFFFLVSKNGVPIAYGPASVFMGCCEMGINLFPEFRGGEIRFIYAQFMRVLHGLVGVDYFYLTRYGMGEDNEDAIRTGAFWFYRKLGFELANPRVEALARAEEEKMKASPGYRSDRKTLRRLSHTEAFLDLSGGTCRPIRFETLGLLQGRHLATRYGGDRARGEAHAIAQTARALEVGRERAALSSLAPLLSLIPDLPSWSERDKALLTRILREKGARSEVKAARLFGKHQRLRAALERLIEQSTESSAAGASG